MKIKTNANKLILGDVIRASEKISALQQYLDKRTDPRVILFVDLSNSTKLKTSLKQQSKWLSIICKFLVTVSDTIVANKGLVVKYIGDEVLAVFPEDELRLARTSAENCIVQCEKKLKRLGGRYIAKYALDYGRPAEVTFPHGIRDVLGTCVDRCARIAKYAQTGTAVATQEFVDGSPFSDAWRLLGSVECKGISGSVKVFQLSNLGERILFESGDLAGKSSSELAARIKTLESQLQQCHTEISRLHKLGNRS